MAITSILLSAQTELEEQNIHIKSIFFGGGSYFVDEEQKQELWQWLDEFEEIERYEIIIQGHTDDIGSLEYNQVLSEYRTRSVFDLLQQHAIPEEIIQIKSFGEKDPIYDNNSWLGKLKNRRADVIIKPINM